jgi:outer membrane protein OmpA-like peptidoglycan-associated protein
MRSRLAALLPALLLMAGCQPQQRPNTAAPAASAPASLALPPPEGVRRYDKPVTPVDETRTARIVQPPRPATSPRPSEREKQAIATWEKEEAAANGPSPLSVAPPPRTRASTLALPGGPQSLPKPAAERTAVGAPTTGDLTVPPSAGDRPELPKVAAAEPPKTNPAPPASPPRPPAPVKQAEPAPAPVAPPAAPPPAAPPSAAPPPAPAVAPAQTASAAPGEPQRLPPNGPTLTTVTFQPRSANLSEQARVALGWFAQDPATQRLRRIELWAWSGDDDPADARKIAFARALAVHAFLIDAGVKAQIEIGGFAETHGVAADRVDVMSPR